MTRAGAGDLLPVYLATGRCTACDPGEEIVGAKLIAYECVASEHRGTAMPDKLTIYRGAWAFCPHGVGADGHDWRTTGGEDLDVLMRRDGHSIMKSIESSGVSADRTAPAKA